MIFVTSIFHANGSSVGKMFGREPAYMNYITNSVESETKKKTRQTTAENGNFSKLIVRTRCECNKTLIWQHIAHAYLHKHSSNETDNRKSKFWFRMWMTKLAHNLRNCSRTEPIRPAHCSVNNEISAISHLLCKSSRMYQCIPCKFYSLLYEFIYFLWTSSKNNRQKCGFALERKLHSTLSHDTHSESGEHVVSLDESQWQNRFYSKRTHTCLQPGDGLSHAAWIEFVSSCSWPFSYTLWCKGNDKADI